MKEGEIRDNLYKLPALLSSPPNHPPLCSQRNLLDSQIWPLPSYSKTHSWLLFDEIPAHTLLPSVSQTLAILFCSQIFEQVISSANPLLPSCLSPINPHLSELSAQVTSYLGQASCDGPYTIVLPCDIYHTVQVYIYCMAFSLPLPLNVSSMRKGIMFASAHYCFPRA